METLKQKKVADLVTEDINNAHVFKKNGIDFCCGGGISIEEACKKKNLQVDKVIKELENVNKTVRHFDYDKWELDFLAKHIENVHHSYVEENVPILKQYADKVAKVHGDHSPELHDIRSIFYNVAAELIAHLKKEELILFPFITRMEQAQKQGTSLERPHFGSAENPINMMENEHESAGNAFKEIARLSHNYHSPEHACNTYRAFYHKLDEFEQDLHLHIHLENNILFPKAIQLEKQVFS